MALTLQQAKDYLRVDYSYDDAFIQQCLDASLSYLTYAVSDDFDTLYSGDARFAELADIAQYNLIAEMYTNRDARNDSRDNHSYVVRSAILQLQNYKGA